MDTPIGLHISKTVEGYLGDQLPEESVFLRHGDYWIIRYEGEGALFKARRGLDYLDYLLRRPAEEVHVSELITIRPTLPLLTTPASLRQRRGDHAVTPILHDIGPILDLRAKQAYRRRIDELRNDIEEAERFNDFYRAAKSRSEMDAVIERLVTAVGLGGKDRPSSSNAERARSAVTKRIKEAVNSIAQVLPPLGRHLGARIKTGYFCSYNPHPDRPVAWKF